MEKLSEPPDRSGSYPSNTWEYKVAKTDKNYTYYFPLTEDMKGKKMEALVVSMRDGKTNFSSEVWLTTNTIPFEKQTLILK